MTDFIVSAEGDVKHAAATVISDAEAEKAAIEEYGKNGWNAARLKLEAEEKAATAAVDAEWNKIRWFVIIGCVAAALGLLVGHFA